MRITLAYALLFYVAFAVFGIATAARIYRYIKTPVPLIIPTTPAPTTYAGVLWRLSKEVVLFYSLFRASKWTWLFGWLFHFGLLIVLLHHIRFFTDPFWPPVMRIGLLGAYPAGLMLVGLVGLLVRRCAVDRIRYISAPSDYLLLVLLIAIVITGLGMKYIAFVNVVEVRDFMLGLWRLNWQPLPANPVLLVHLALAALLLIIFPFSKLLHAPGIFFSPTLNMRDSSRRRRHLNPWQRDRS